MNLEELYKKETGKECCFRYTCGREYLFIETTEYKNWLEQKAEEGQKAIAAMEQIDTLWQSHAHSGDDTAETQWEFDKQLVVILSDQLTRSERGLK